MPFAIETDRLTKTYGANRGIRDITLQIAPGEIFGFLGPNGAGKSTTMRTLIGLMRPTSGRCTILGISPHEDPVGALRNVGNLPTEFGFAGGMTGRQMIRYFADLRRIDDISFADTIAKRLDADLDRPMRRLSRGNKQKVAIVQALFHRPPVIVLDEPTGGLDPLVQDEFLTVLEEAKATGQTIFFSSHVLSEVERIADRVGIIRDGEMVAVERPSDLTRRALRHVSIRFAQDQTAEDVAAFKALPEVRGFHHAGRDVTFTTQGDMDRVIKLVARYDIDAFDAERPSLEEIFLGFYGESFAQNQAARP